METTFKKRPSSATAQENDKDKQQQNSGKETGKDKQWWEQFIGAIPEDK